MINVQHDTENRGRMSVHLTCGLESNKPVTVLNFNKTAEPDPSNRRSASYPIDVSARSPVQYTRTKYDLKFYSVIKSFPHEKSKKMVP